MDLKSIGLCPRRFEPCRRRFFRSKCLFLSPAFCFSESHNSGSCPQRMRQGELDEGGQGCCLLGSLCLSIYLFVCIFHVLNNSVCYPFSKIKFVILSCGFTEAIEPSRVAIHLRKFLLGEQEIELYFTRALSCLKLIVIYNSYYHVQLAFGYIGVLYNVFKGKLHRVHIP